MSERGNGKIIAIAAVALAGVGGAAYWFFGIRAKDEQHSQAQAEILQWETRLAAARECLFGKTPASSDSGEALAVRELTPDPWDRATCTKLVGALARGVADDTGLMPVEHAWMTLNRAAAKVATAFAVSKDPYGKTAADERRGVSDLPDALRELDKAHAELRQAAKLPPAASATIAPLPVAQVVPMLVGGAQITGIDLYPRPSAGTLVMWGVAKEAPVQITLVPGQTPRIEKVPPFTVRSMTPDASWGAAGLGGGVAVSTMDGEGAFASPQTISPTGGSLLAAVGPFDDSLVAFASQDGLVFAHGKGSPPTFTLDKPIRAGVTQVAFDPIAGRALISWAELPAPSKRASDEESDAPTALVGTIVQNGSPVQTVSLGSGAPSWSCLSRRHGYVVTYDQVLRFDASGMTPLEVDTSKFSLEGCGAGGALFVDAGTTRYTVCTDAGCRLVDLRGARPSDHAALASDHVVSIAVRERVLAVWSEKAAPTFYRLPEKVVPRKVISDGKTIDVIAESATENKPLHYVLVRVPAT